MKEQIPPLRDFPVEALSEQHVRVYREIANRCRGRILTMTARAKSGHPAGSLSSLEMTLMTYAVANVTPAGSPDRDYVVVSHGHTSPATYAVLGELGFFDPEQASAHFRACGSPFQGHVERSVPGIDWGSGNLGQGLSAGVGYALKLAQRAQALRHGITEMRWTYDPMLFTNARFNLVRLGARPMAFLPHCYGDRRDAFNTGDTTDRLEVSWALDHAVGGAATVAASEDLQLELPTDYHALRAGDVARADEWRRQVSAALAAAIADGHRVMMGERGYVILGGAG